MSKPSTSPYDDPLYWVIRGLKRLHSLWLMWTYPFVAAGPDLSVHYSCSIRRSLAGYITIGNHVLLDKDTRLDLPIIREGRKPAIIIGDGVRIGPRVVVSAINKIQIGNYTIFGPSVLVMDHNHAFQDVTKPIADQGVTEGGNVIIEEGCWIGFGAAIVCNEGELVIGRNSVIGANSVITRSIPPYSVVSGNPGRVVKHYDPAKKSWVIGSASQAGVPS